MSRMSIGSLLNDSAGSHAENSLSTSPPPSSPEIGRTSVTEEIILAPHLRTRVPANHVAHPPPLSPLDALVHAATASDDVRKIDVGEGPSSGLYPHKRRRPSNDLFSPTTINYHQQSYPANNHFRVPTASPSPSPTTSGKHDSPDGWFHDQLMHRNESTHSRSPVHSVVKPEFSSPFRGDSDRDTLTRSSPFQPAMDVDPGLPSHPPNDFPPLLGPGVGLQEQLDLDADRQSMPPPSTQSNRSSAVGATGRKKPGPKPKPKPPPGFNADGTVKVRKKPGPKPKPRNPDGTIIRDPAELAGRAAPSKGSKKSVSTTPAAAAAATSASRSRSTSVLPKDVASPVPPDSELQIESDEKDVDHASSDKLYCICQTPYDEDKVMIACDRCDEWYHTNCVDMQDLGVELVDQFYCPPCITKNPNLSLHTTYKKRCLFGSSHPAPETPEACHKAARGAFSKYCSEDCGVRHMRTKVETWENDGGKRNSLWKSVRTAEKPEGIVVRVSPPGTSPRMRDERESDDLEVAHHILGEIVQPTITQVERETRRLEEVLEHVVKLREDVTRGMAVLLWREQLLELARARAKRIGSCGWDQRLCFSDDEVAGFGEGVLESYEQLNHAQDGMDANPTNQWWCLEDDCDRHDNWQNIRQRDINKEKEQKEAALAKLTTRERKIRAHIEDINDHGPMNLKTPKPVINGDTKKVSKKRKVPP